MKRLFFTLGVIIITYNFSYSQLGVGMPDKFTRKDSLRGTLSTERANYDVRFYKLDLKIDIENKFISGSNVIRFDVKKDLPVLQFDLFENLKITKIEWNSKQLDYKREFNAVFVRFPKALSAGTSSAIKIYYEGNPTVAKRAPWDGGFVFKKDKNGKPFVGVACQGTGASLWWPNKDHQSDEPDSMAINITSPSEYEEVSNGRLRNKKVLGDGYTRFEWFVSEPINNYNVSVNIADYHHWKDTYISKIDGEILTLDYYVLKDDKEKAEKQFTQVKPMMEVFEKRFWKYPFYKDGYKLVQTPYLGMEHQSCVAYGNAYKNGYLGMDLSGSGEGLKFDYIIIHETAHEWWGNNLTSYDIADMWIHEGFGQYSECVYLEEMFGKESANKYLLGIRKGIGNNEPVIGPYGVNKEGSGDMYPKGAQFLHTLRSVVNDDVMWWNAILSLQKDYRHKNISSEDVLAHFNKKLNFDIEPIFKQYLNYPKIPKLKYQVNQIGEDVEIKYYWHCDVNSFNMPIDLIINNSKTRIYPSTKIKTETLKKVAINDVKFDISNFYITTEVIDK